MKKNQLDEQFDWYLPYYSQFGQDKFLNEEVFKNKKHGIFVEVGAYDGIKLSNTYFFEKNMEWSGICIEPIPGLFFKLKANRKCFCINKCVSDKNKKAKFLHVLGGNEYEIIADDEYPKIKGREHTEMLSGLLDFYNPEHKKLIDRELCELGGAKNIFETECILLNDVFEYLPMNSKIDYLSIDTEGGELQILQAVDFDRFDIDVIGLEVLYPDKNIEVFMSKIGYKLINRLGYDCIYRKI